MPVISNTTPLILYAKIGRMHLLQSADLYLAESVYREVLTLAGE